MKLIFISMISACMIAVSCNRPPGQSDAGRPDGDTARAPVIDRPIPAYELDAFYKGAITKVSLAGYRGKWLILFFYPSDFSFVCPTELKELADYYPEFKKLGAEVLSVSTDSAFAHRAWHRQDEMLKQVAYPMLSDRNGRLSRHLGVYDDLSGAAMRASFVVDPEGIIVACEIHTNAIGRSVEELLRKLSAATAVRREAGGYCPAGWKQGEGLIHPR